MVLRTFTRTYLNAIFRGNIFFKTLKNIVNFYYKFINPTQNDLSFTKINPINKMKRKSVSFLSVTGDKIDCK